ncbi:MAG TPA: Sec-independent protein translocase subunit TatA [Actinomycetales bacterium]|nr:Sec-independent protein translocase subunit TatA [Actinomycetales bacterium]
MFRNLLDGPHLLIILVVILLLFGGKKLPEAARGLGRSMRIFKSEVKEMREDDDETPPRGPIEGRVVDDRNSTGPGTAPRTDSTGTDDVDRQREQRRGA